MNWLLAGCGLLFLVFVGVGYKRGLVKVLFSLISFVLVMVVVGIISPVIGTVLQEKTPLQETISGKCAEVIQEWNAGGDTASTEGRLELLEQYQLPDTIKQYLKTDITFEALEQDFTTYISNKMAELIIDAIAYAVAFVVVWAAFWIVVEMLGVVAKLPGLKTLNRLGGAVAGGAEGVLIIWSIFLVITVCCTTSWGKQSMEMITESKILTFIYEKNVMMKFIPGFKVL